MTHDEALAWGRRWVDDWNRHDVEAVIAHFADDVEFRSPVITQVTGDPSGVVQGKDALRAYWTTALESHRDLHFELDDVHVGVDCISIQYRNQTGRHVTEMAQFDADGKVVRGFGLYGAA
jgi:ketosteroid isomerase-like protein